jgi:hypothetical protein
MTNAAQARITAWRSKILRDSNSRPPGSSFPWATWYHEQAPAGEYKKGPVNYSEQS